MSVTTTLRDELADRLARQTQGRQVSLEECATRILAEAVGDKGGEIAWFNLNSRRLALISKEYAPGLTDVEAAEHKNSGEAGVLECGNLLATWAEIASRPPGRCRVAAADRSRGFQPTEVNCKNPNKSRSDD